MDMKCKIDEYKSNEVCKNTYQKTNEEVTHQKKKKNPNLHAGEVMHFICG